MLNAKELENFRELRGLSYREVSNYCDVTHTMISEVEKGNRGLTKETHDEIVKGINLAYQAKQNGTLKAENTRKPKESPDGEIQKAESGDSVKMLKPTRKSTTKTTK